MTWVSLALVAFGVADLVRSPAGRMPLGSAPLAGVLTLVLLSVVTGVHGVADVVALVVVAVALVGWTETSRRTQADGRRAWLPLGLFAALVVALLAFSGFASEPSGPLSEWLRWADLPWAADVSVSRVLLLAGLVVFNLATGNIIVRLVLLAIGALRPDQVVAAQSATSDPQPADRLKGGRLLGPMERLVILGLGLAGEYGAASIVIAAKGLLRFPEIQAAARTSPPPTSTRVGIDDMTEYFLVGSFVSWLVALGSLALAR
ncbi:hypothetical protein OO014_13965 [Intrasporangium calvum]|uniref:Integral membrane protein n=1 Tax=Intrasporangium calvum TaxID=53358 RepID=A0ABT5GJE0_9MICO|nr:hypothetical protein [Intrasporangium calvum]MDC5698360.1 hypothetical protein [Intrasporangium calvum]